jgi:hypothetical protein
LPSFISSSWSLHDLFPSFLTLIHSPRVTEPCRSKPSATPSSTPSPSPLWARKFPRWVRRLLLLLPVFSSSQIVASRARFVCAGKLHRHRQWPPLRPFLNLAGCSLPPSPDLISAA